MPRKFPLASWLPTLLSLVVLWTCSSIVTGDPRDEALEKIRAALKELDTPPVLGLSIDLPEISEKGGKVTLTAKISKVWKSDVVANLKFSGEASAADFESSANSIKIAAGQTEASITIAGVDDAFVEPAEELVVEIESASEVDRVAIPKATVTITSEDEPPPPPPPPEPELPPPVDPEAIPPVLSFDQVKIKDHPRLFWRNDAAVRIGLVPDLMQQIIAASAPTAARTPNRMLCRAVRFRLGEAAQGPLAVADLLSIAIPNLDVHHGIWHLQPHAIAYDWLYEILTDDQRSEVRKKIYVGLQGGKYWSGYNYDAGIGMTSALAIEGDVLEGEEIPIGYARQYWETCWWGTKIPLLYNRAYERDWQPDGGVREGWSYTGDQADVVAAAAAWESATGDRQSLNYSWLTRMPLMLLHQCRNPNMFSLPAFEYGGDSLYGTGILGILQAGTGARDPKTAAVSAWLRRENSKSFSTQPVAETVLFQALIGDPSVKPQSPAELGLPLRYTTRVTGYVYDRTSWDEDATRVFFGCQEPLTRDFPMGDVMVSSRKKVPIGSRAAAYRHNYAPPWSRNVPLLYADKTLIMPAIGNSTPQRFATCSMRSVGNGWVAELQGLYPKRGVELVRRTWAFDRDTQTGTATDEIKCPKTLTPRITWNTPELPTIEEDGITFVSSGNTCRMTFDAKPAEILLRGGVEGFEWARDYAGNIDPKVPTDKGKEFAGNSLSQQLNKGGHYTIWITPPKVDGIYRLTTTIAVR